MTHDELLELLDEHMVFAEGLGPIVVLALRAVVELHKPVIVLTDDPVIVCSHCESTDYPCPTIQSIERKLA